MSGKDQVAYWDRVAAAKTFSHPLDRRLLEHVPTTDRILDLGCGYGRTARELRALGYLDVVGADSSPEMIARARAECPELELQVLSGMPWPWPDASFGALLLFSVLTCVPFRDDQRALLAEVRRVLRPGGVLYVSDLLIQADDRNRARYAAGEARYGERGIFELEEGAIFCHLDEERLALVRAGCEELAFVELDVTTMNGHAARGFQFLGRLLFHP